MNNSKVLFLGVLYILATIMLCNSTKEHCSKLTTKIFNSNKYEVINFRFLVY